MSFLPELFMDALFRCDSGGRIAHVLLVKMQLHIIVDSLHRLAIYFHKAGAQQFVAAKDFIEALLQRIFIQLAA